MKISGERTPKKKKKREMRSQKEIFIFIHDLENIFAGITSLVRHWTIFSSKRTEVACAEMTYGNMEISMNKKKFS
ncbi:CLUMA_CG007346, isoform A [Clunio marinus]|uniref:CLUMA_CG007346, isoform A n=1 Tax=Clunio marinus TaxID=568069 RepID=A0A1J1I0U4_9DIPT|nr:CLUMA_CG007346, isoform A [Clunio marinus]